MIFIHTTPGRRADVDRSGVVAPLVGVGPTRARRQRVGCGCGGQAPGADRRRGRGNRPPGARPARQGRARRARIAVHLLEKLDDQDSLAGAWESLGAAYHGLADYERAADCYRNSIELYAELDHRPWLGRILNQLGDVHQATGDTGAAFAAWQRALDTLDGLNDPDLDPESKAIRAKLAADAPTAPTR